MSPGKKVWSKCVGIRQDPNKPWYESAGLRPREGSTQSKSRTKCAKRCGWSSGDFALHPRQSSLQHVHLANASFAELKAWRKRDTISFYVVPPQEKKDLEFAQESLWYSRHESSVCNTRGGGCQRTRSSERRNGAVVVLESNVEDVQCLLVRWLHSCHFRCQNKRP